MALKKRFCPHCEAIREVVLIIKPEKYRYGGENIIIQAEVLICKTCKKEFATTEMEERNLQAVYKKSL